MIDYNHIQNSSNTNPDSCEYCPFTEWHKEDIKKQLVYCKVHKAYMPYIMQCDVSPTTLKSLMMRNEI